MKPKSVKPIMRFNQKLLLNQWLISQLGIDPLRVDGKPEPFKRLIEPIVRSPEGLTNDGHHLFFENLLLADFFRNEFCAVKSDELRRYDENLVRHTQAINARRTTRPIVWKYYQWLSLLFAEIYLDRYFADKKRLLSDLNGYVERFNAKHAECREMPRYEEDDLNKLCLQNATGSGKTLLMHVNLLQYRHYAERAGKGKELPRTILITPNERLTEQHIDEFTQSGFFISDKLTPGEQQLNQIDVIEITKLGDKTGPQTIAVSSLGDQNLLLVDEGHRGMSGQDEGAWFTRRAALCAKGFVFEYSATFEQAVAASKSQEFEDSYAKTVLFDYSYRWFYEDGFGKDYQILNIPKSHGLTQSYYLTACLLKYYQQLHLYGRLKNDITDFNLEKPLWVFVGNTVSKVSGDVQTVTDIAQIIRFIAHFLSDEKQSVQNINLLLNSSGQETGLMAEGVDIFEGAFNFLKEEGLTPAKLFKSMLTELFQNAAGGQLTLSRVKGDSGEIALRAGATETPFGLINVGDAKGLCDHLDSLNDKKYTVEESEFSETHFAKIKESSSPINLLVGAKKFIEGWDCWRVSTMGLMHVGKSEGAQIIQLFGRGVRLKGYQWSLKRSGHITVPSRPKYLYELETLNVFGIEADFMQTFRDFLKEQGLPGNERRHIVFIPMHVTYDFGKGLKVIRPKKKREDGTEYNFQKDGPVAILSGDIPNYLKKNRVVVDWYPRITRVKSTEMRGAGSGQELLPTTVVLRDRHRAFLDYDRLYFELEAFKRERGWHTLTVTRQGIEDVLRNAEWYTLLIPSEQIEPIRFANIRLMQQVASELLKGYCDRFYNQRKRSYIEPRLEIRELTAEDENIPNKDDVYSVVVEASEEEAIREIEALKADIEAHKEEMAKRGAIKAINFKHHLFQPLLHLGKGSKITITPVALNEHECQFVEDLAAWCKENAKALKRDGAEIFLLRNRSRGEGVGFFEAAGFHPDFILWVLKAGKQYVTFVEPHGLRHEGSASPKVLFHLRVKEIEKRLNDRALILNSFILSPTPHSELQWGPSQEALERQHILFMVTDQERYLDKLFAALGVRATSS